MRSLVYDGSFDGFLSAIFAVYEYKLSGDAIISRNTGLPGQVNGASQNVVTDKSKAERVWKGLEQKLTARACIQLYRAFLSEKKEIENVMLRYIQYVFSTKKSVEYNYSHPDVLTIQQLGQKVFREKHRMEAFVRFQLTKDGLFYAIVQPDHNVLPLISNHFKARYADQRWLIYDSQRKYGIYYNLQDVTEVELKFEEGLQEGKTVHTIYDEREGLYQLLWRQYFTGINIDTGKNMKLHIQYTPRRYWKNLTEKKSDFDMQ